MANMTQAMAIEWGPKGIRVNAIAPGFIDAGMSKPIYADPKVREVRGGGVPLRRLGDANDIAKRYYFWTLKTHNISTVTNWSSMAASPIASWHTYPEDEKTADSSHFSRRYLSMTLPRHQRHLADILHHWAFESRIEWDLEAGLAGLADSPVDF